MARYGTETRNKGNFKAAILDNSFKTGILNVALCQLVSTGLATVSESARGNVNTYAS